MTMLNKTGNVRIM